MCFTSTLRRMLVHVTLLTIVVSCFGDINRLTKKNSITHKNGIAIEFPADENSRIVESKSSICLQLRGGADKERKLDVISHFRSKIVLVLKQIIPKSWWPATWSKSSKLMKKSRVGGIDVLKGETSTRLQKELRSFVANPPANCKLTVGANIRVWVVSITGAEGTIYAGEKFKLKMIFPKEYPSKPPSVYFLKPTPKHVHVYSNGDICLNLLGRDWRPSMTAESLVVSIQSMLASAREKKMPQDNSMHADMPPGQQQDNWMYHDDKC